MKNKEWNETDKAREKKKESCKMNKESMRDRKEKDDKEKEEI